MNTVTGASGTSAPVQAAGARAFASGRSRDPRIDATKAISRLIGTPVWALALCAFAIAACIPMRAVLVRAAPWMLGLKRK